MPSYSNSAFSACSFIGFIVSIVPFYWHARARNVGTCLFMFWSSLGCLNLFIDSCIWKGNTMDVAPVWCDISTRVLIAQNIGIPASILCITRRLYMLTDVSGGTSIDKRREAFIDLGIGLGLPIVEVGMYYIVQGHRYNIFEDVGCRPIIINTVVAFGLVYTWPLVISAVSAAYGLCAIYRFTRHSRELRALLSVDKTNKGRNIRLILIAGADIFGSIPISIYNIYCDSTYISPWVSWRYLHSDFSQVEQIPASVWKANSDMYAGIEETQWVTVACAFVFFTLFGIFSQEAIGHYQLFCRMTRSWIGRLAALASLRSSAQSSTTHRLTGTAAEDPELGREGKPRVTLLDAATPDDILDLNLPSGCALQPSEKDLDCFAVQIA